MGLTKLHKQLRCFDECGNQRYDSQQVQHLVKKSRSSDNQKNRRCQIWNYQINLRPAGVLSTAITSEEISGTVPETARQPARVIRRTVSTFRTQKTLGFRRRTDALYTDVCLREVSTTETPKDIITINVDGL